MQRAQWGHLGDLDAPSPLPHTHAARGDAGTQSPQSTDPPAIQFAFHMIPEEEMEEPEAHLDSIIPLRRLNEGVPVSKKPGAWTNIMTNAKAKIYNMYRAGSKDPSPVNPNTPLVLLGKSYFGPSTHGDYESAIRAFRMDFERIVWLTYRKKFVPMIPLQLTTDMGWGCMLRSGQMMLAEAFSRFYLGREWRLTPQTAQSRVHRRILRWFEDKPSLRSPYSIHNMAHVGTCFGKKVGEWFEPSKVTNVMRVLVRKHSPDGITMYVARDRVIYRSNVDILCSYLPPGQVVSPKMSRRKYERLRSTWSHTSSTSVDDGLEQNDDAGGGRGGGGGDGGEGGDNSDEACPSGTGKGDATVRSLTPRSNGLDTSGCHGAMGRGPGTGSKSAPSSSSNLGRPSPRAGAGAPSPTLPARFPEAMPSSGGSGGGGGGRDVSSSSQQEARSWRPVIIVIPVRLGVDVVNPVYMQHLRSYFELPQCLGIIGGKPNASLYFVGCQDDQLYFLDPHCVQSAVTMLDPHFPTTSYHTATWQSMPFTEMDPSMALGFFCPDRVSFLRLCESLDSIESSDPVVTVADEDPNYSKRKEDDPIPDVVFSACMCAADSAE